MRLFLSLALWSSSFALAAAVPINPTPTTPAAICPPLPPSGQNCNSVYWLSTCGVYYGATPGSLNNPCTVGNPSLEKAWRDNWLLAHPQGLKTDSAFKPALNDFIAAVPPELGLPDAGFEGTLTTWAAHEEQARVLGRQLVSPNVYTWKRPDTMDGGAMVTCEDYVYRSFYDVERWVDGINACKDNARCKVSISTIGSNWPSIARRTLSDVEGNPIYASGTSRVSEMFSKGQISQMEADPFSDAYRLGSVPKNSFYANTTQLFPPALVNAFVDAGMGLQISGLVDETSRGATLYAVGFNAGSGGAWSEDSVGIHQNFSDEWDFHEQMNQRTALVTEGEFREYRARNAAIIEAFDQGTDQMKCLYANKMVVGGCNPKQINALGKANPGDKHLWEGDPFAARSILGSISEYSFTWPPSMQNQVGFGTELQQSMVTMSDIQAGTVSSGLDQIGQLAHLPGMTKGLLVPKPVATPPGVSYIAVLPTVPLMIHPSWPNYVPHVDPAANMAQGTLKWMLEKTWKANPPRIDRTRTTPMLDCRLPGRLVVRGGPAPLQVDADFHTETVWPQVCAMTNVMLTEWARKLTNKPSCLDRLSSKCDWSPQDFVDRFVTKNIGYGAAAKEVEYKYCKRWTAGGKLADQNPNIGLSYAARTNLASFRAALAAREAAFGEKLSRIPIKAKNDFGSQKKDEEHLGDKVFGGGYAYDLSWHATSKARDADGNICRMAGSVNASFTAHATLFAQKFNVVDAFASVTSNELDDAKGWATAHLIVVGYEFFNTGADPIDLTASISPKLPSDMSDSERIQLLKLPFQVGPVTVTVTAGISFDYGSTLTFESKVPALNSCELGAPIFTVKSLFKPYADLGVWVDADASLAGVVGVGLEVDLTLVGLALPLQAQVVIEKDPAQGNVFALVFNASLDLELTTMKGQINFYIEALFMQVASFKIVSWPGFTHRFPIFRTPTVALALTEMTGDILPPASNESQPN